MRITAVDAIPFGLPVRRDFRWNGLHQGLGNFVLIRVHTDRGIIGYGEAVPLADWGGDYARRAGETQGTVISIIKTTLEPALAGADPCAIGAALAAMDRVAIGHSYAKCAIEMALHDIWGKSLGLPVYKLLGGAMRDAVPVAHMVGLMPVDDAVEEGAGAAADGAKALQVKGGEDPGRDIAVIRALRKRLGPDIVLRLDANQGYQTAKQALRVLDTLAAEGLSFIEQPVEGLPGMRGVTASTSVPVVADESCWTPRDALDVVQHEAADCISIYLAKAGGFRPASVVGAIAAAAQRPCDVNGSIESGVGNAANLHFAIACPAVTLPAVIPVSAPAGQHPCKVAGHYFGDDIVCEPFPYRDGALGRLEKPGLGIEVDEAKLDRFRQG